MQRNAQYDLGMVFFVYVWMQSIVRANPGAAFKREFSFPNTATRRIFAAVDILFHFCGVSYVLTRVGHFLMSSLLGGDSKLYVNARYNAYVLSQLADEQSEHLEDLKNNDDVRVYLSMQPVCDVTLGRCSYLPVTWSKYYGFECTSCRSAYFSVAYVVLGDDTKYSYRVVWEGNKWRLVAIN
jgi:hypothetical protein